MRAWQVLLPPAAGLLGSVVLARIVSASRWSVVGKVVPAVPSMPVLPAADGLPCSPALADGGSRHVPPGGHERANIASAIPWAVTIQTSSDSSPVATRGVSLRGPPWDAAEEVSASPYSREDGGRSTAFSTDAQPARLAKGVANQPDLRSAAAANAIIDTPTGIAVAVLPDISAYPASAKDSVAPAAASAAMSSPSTASSTVRDASNGGAGVRGVNAELPVRTPGKKQDFVDDLLALGVVLGLLGVLIVGVSDLVNCFVHGSLS